MSSEEDRAALLEKIRADMAASRQKIAEMKEKKARGTVVLDTTSTEEKASDTKKFEETTNLVERLRAERAAKKQATATVDDAAKNTATEVKHPTQKLATEGRDRSPSMDRFRPNMNRMRGPSIDQGRMRGPSIDQGRTRQPSMDQGRFRTPSMDQGRSRQPSMDQGRRVS
mgnify:CR=1 FL=1